MQSICPASVLVEGEGRANCQRGRGGGGLRGELGSFLLQMQSPVVQSLTEEQVGGRPDRALCLPCGPSPRPPQSHFPPPTGSSLAVRRPACSPSYFPKLKATWIPAPLLHSLRVQAGGQ